MNKIILTIKEELRAAILDANKELKEVIDTNKELKESILAEYKEHNNFNDKYDYSSITDMSYLLDNCNELEIIPILYTQNVINMERMFAKTNLCHIELEDTSNVTNMNKLAYLNRKLITIKFKNTSNVKLMNEMFYECYKLEEVINLDSSNATSMESIYCRCTNINKVSYIDTKKHNLNELFKDTPIRNQEKLNNIIVN